MQFLNSERDAAGTLFGVWLVDGLPHRIPARNADELLAQEIVKDALAKVDAAVAQARGVLERAEARIAEMQASAQAAIAEAEAQAAEQVRAAQATAGSEIAAAREAAEARVQSAWSQAEAAIATAEDAAARAEERAARAAEDAEATVAATEQQLAEARRTVDFVNGAWSTVMTRPDFAAFVRENLGAELTSLAEVFGAVMAQAELDDIEPAIAVLQARRAALKAQLGAAAP
ncbi:hypothetical protein [Zavarzinia sp. CC-PAN008]|uniref:hypothetical protein n=1 Tax=Zavarzinia sp. CC-PAN008 TaxID=3243332 RepID=UPI003F7432F8